MSTAATALAAFGSTQWDAQVYASMAKASEIFGIIKNRGQAIRLAFTLWRLNGELDDLLETAYGILEGRIPAKPSDEPLTPERVRDSEQAVRRLGSLMRAIYDEGRRKHLTNYSILGGALSRLKISAEELVDLADWISDVADEANVNAAFERSRTEQDRGEVFDLSQV